MSDHSFGRRIDDAIKLALECGQTDGAHHKMWVIDQIVRILAGDNYESLIRARCDGEDGPDTYAWDVGTPP